MVRSVILAAGLGLIATPTLTQELPGTPLSGEEFGAYVTGKTLMFGTGLRSGGEPYGGEDYLPGNRVRWSFLDGQCLEGRWYAEDQSICFVYTDSPEPVCWAFFKAPGGLTAFLNGDPDQVLYETGEATEPLYCVGPDVGV